MIKRFIEWILVNIFGGYIEQPAVETPPAAPPNNYNVKWLQEGKPENECIEAGLIAASMLDACEKFAMALNNPALDGPFVVTFLSSGGRCEVPSIKRLRADHEEMKKIQREQRKIRRQE